MENQEYKNGYEHQLMVKSITNDKASHLKQFIGQFSDVMSRIRKGKINLYKIRFDEEQHYFREDELKIVKK